MYGVSGIPHVEWNGHDSQVGGASGGNWESLYPGYLVLYNDYITEQTPYRLGISGEYVPGETTVNFFVEVLVDEIDSTLDNTNTYLELFVVEDNIYSYWSTVDQWHNARNVGRKYITKSDAQKLPISVSESGQSETFTGSFELSEDWVHSNVKLVALVQQLNDGTVHPVLQVETSNVNDLAPDPDGDGLTVLYDNCHLVYNPDQSDVDGDGDGDVCDPCNNLVNIPGNVDLNSSGDGYQPIINVSDILAFADLLQNEGLPPNDCQSVDLLEDGVVNDWDLIVLVDMVMAGD